MPGDKLTTNLSLIIDLKFIKQSLLDGPKYAAIFLAVKGFFLMKTKILNSIHCLQHLYITLPQDCCQVKMGPKYAL